MCTTGAVGTSALCARLMNCGMYCGLSTSCACCCSCWKCDGGCSMAVLAGSCCNMRGSLAVMLALCARPCCEAQSSPENWPSNCCTKPPAGVWCAKGLLGPDDEPWLSGPAVQGFTPKPCCFQSLYCSSDVGNPMSFSCPTSTRLTTHVATVINLAL